MSETTPDTGQNNEAVSGTSPSTEANTGAPPSNLEETGFRYGAGAPAYLQGKTASEAIDFVNNLVSEAQQLYQTVNTQYQPQPQQTTVTPQNSTDPDLWLTDPAKAEQAHSQKILGQVQNYIGQASQPLLQSNAQISRDVVQQRNKDVFNKWGHEVDQIVANVPLAQRSPALYEQAVKMVKANHVEELAQARAESLMAAGTGLESGGGRGADPFAMVDAEGRDVWEKFEQSDVGRNLTARLSKRQITELCDKAGMSVEEYADMVARSKARVDPGKGTVVNDELRSWEM
jgi:hypothetical protein